MATQKPNPHKLTDVPAGVRVKPPTQDATGKADVKPAPSAAEPKPKNP